jgi:hypothetical protein
VPTEPDALEVMIGGRRSGKTTRMMEWVLSTEDAVVVVATAKQRKWWVDSLRREGLTRATAESRVVLPGGKDRLRGRRVRLGVDDAEWVLAAFLGQAPERMTATAVPWWEKNDA